jgi:hypothetical protein
VNAVEQRVERAQMQRGVQRGECGGRFSGQHVGEGRGVEALRIVRVQRRRARIVDPP